MKHLLTFQDFLNENYPSPYKKDSLYFNFGKKINLFCKSTWFAIDPFTGVDEILNTIGKELFNVIIDKDYFAGKTNLDNTLPAIGFDRYLTRAMIEKENYPSSLIYNLPDSSDKYRKTEYYTTLQNKKSPNLPKTVFKKEDISNLTFPIIAKSELTWKSKGVEKFDTLENFNETDKEFDLYQEAINIDKEYRALILKGKNDSLKILSISLREPINNKAKSLRIEESVQEDIAKISNNEAASFKWTHINLDEDKTDNNVNLDEVSKLIKESSEISSDMNFYSVDFARDKNGKYWHLECNTQPGMNGISSVILYLNVFKDYYGISLFNDDKHTLQSLMFRLVEKTKNVLKGYTIDNQLILDDSSWFGKEI